MANNLQQALRRMRNCERDLSRALLRAQHSGQAHRYAQVRRRIMLAERHLLELEQEIQVA